MSSYRPLVLLAVGKFERSTGFDLLAEAIIDQLSRRSTWFLLGLLRLFGRRIADIFVASDGTTLVGTGTTLWLPRTAYVAGMATLPEHRGRGIASRILALQAEAARRHHRDWIALDVESENESAIRVYQKAGYREVGSYRWYTQPSLPPVPSPVPPSIRPVEKSDWTALAVRLEANRPADYRAAFPAGHFMLNHNENLVFAGHTQRQTWWTELADGAVGVVRAYYVPGAQMGVYFAMGTVPEPRAEEFVGLIDAATAWLRPRGPSRIVAVAAEPAGGISEALERRGFSGKVSTKAMARRTSG